MAINHKKSANYARDHSDAAKRSSEEHRQELRQMQETATEAARDIVERRAYRTRKQELKEKR